MRKIVHCLWLILLLSLLNCSPPEDDENIYSSTYYLCRTSWIAFFSNGESTQHLFFYEDGSGKEIFTDYFSTGPVYEEYKFRWQWYPDNTSIEMQYESGTFIYFDDVQVSTDYLNGFFDGYYTEFERY